MLISPAPETIRQAAGILESGGLVAFPTETVYGLGADAENPQAVAQIFAAKGRPADHPLIVHLSPEADVSYWAVDIPEAARKLMSAFWPGPLTLILKRSQHVPDAVTGGQDSVGLRCPSHPVAQALLRAFRQGRSGLAAPSANRFGRISPTIAQHVREEFSDECAQGGRIGMILDGGPSEVGIESTILDLSRWDTFGAVMLRPGHVSAEAIAGVIGVMPHAPDLSAPRASGTLDAHYAPRTPVQLVQPAEWDVQWRALSDTGRRIAAMHYAARSVDGALASLKLPADPAAYAHRLYAALRELDAAKADVILVEAPPTGSAWLGINDRLRRAAHDSSGMHVT